MNAYQCKEEDLVQSFELFGGIPRSVFAGKTSQEAFRKNLLSVIHSIDVVRLQNFIFDPNAHGRYKILQYRVSDSSYQSFTWEFASVYVQQQVPKVLAEKFMDATVTLIRTVLVDIPWAASLRGYLFQPVAHARLAQGGSFEIRDPKMKLVLDKKEKFVSSMGKKDFSSKLRQFKDKYIQPTIQNYEFADSFIWLDSVTLVAFQFTVSAKHKFDMNEADRYLNLKGVKKLMYIVVVPEDIYDTHVLPIKSSEDGNLELKVLKLDLSQVMNK